MRTSEKGSIFLTKKRVNNKEKIKIVETIINKEETATSASKKFGISRTTISDWLRKYESWGPEGLEAYTRSINYSKEIKLAAVEDVILHGMKKVDVLRKYRITDRGVLRFWIEAYNSGKEFKNKERGLSTMTVKTGKKTTYQQRIEMVQYTLSLDEDYQAAVKKYDVSYQQIYRWVQIYNRLGTEGLKDNRGRRLVSRNLNEQENLSEIDKLRLENQQLKARNEYLEIENSIAKKLKEFRLRGDYFH